MDATTLVTPPYVAGPLRLAPFAALRLTPARVGDPATGRAFARPYRAVASRLQRWQGKGLLERDPVPALYLHEYTANGITVRGLVGALDVSRRARRPEDRVVLPHEGIHPVQADELADRMAEMELNPAPILLVHHGSPELRDLTGKIQAGTPDHAFTDRSQQQHRLWAITDPEVLAALAEQLADTRALIADGHHRYAAYLRLQQRGIGTAYDAGLAMLIDQDDTPLFLGPIHRVLEGTCLTDLEQAASILGLPCERVSRQQAVASLGPTQLAATDGRSWIAVTLEVPFDSAAVEVLHRTVLPALPHGPSSITYHHTVEEALDRAQPEKAVAVLMPAPSVDQALRIAEDDRLLPEKATSFQPKPSLGVLLRPLA
ncbi:DUF1015 domain-containing protein [Nocardioides sp. GY 10113]|uniref:DUF1015 family protein n=1 Tax=Nocardioides sp. GY 10113 TaxID=2569761 RepID=UPI0010A78C76|nr:DUF1015 family protein [Nocardioides sp. GY 10113]TIC79159.1 DUF1015 domain-containing protein [Nocardioides sp. GY 10113]